MTNGHLQPKLPAISPRFSTVAWLISLSVVATVFEGAVRKWVLPDGNPALQAVMYFSKDVPLSIALILSLGCRPQPSRIHAAVIKVLLIGTFLFTSGAFGAIHGFAPVGAVVSARNALLMPWLMYFCSRALTGRGDLQLIVHTIGLCAVLNAVLGAVQFTLPPTHWLNAQVSTKIEAVGSIGRIRASGTFSYLNAMSDLCGISCWAAGVVIGTKPRSWIGYAYALAGLACASAAISRGGVLNGIIVLAIALAVHPRLRILVFLLALAAVAAAMTMEPDASESSSGDEVSLTSAVLARNSSAGDSLIERWSGVYTYQLSEAILSCPFGVGLGRGQSGQVASESQTGVATLLTYEGEPARVVFEVGVVGFLGVAVIRVGLLFLFIQNRPRGKQQYYDFFRSICISTIALILVSCAAGGQFVFNHFAATFQMVAGVCYMAAARAQPVTSGIGRDSQ